MAERAPGWLADAVFTAFAWCCGLAGIVLPLAILGYLAVKGAASISWPFLTEPPRGFPMGMQGGIRPALEGTLALVAGGLVLAVPAGVGGAIYLAEYCRHPRVIRVLRFSMDLLASIPALLFGIWGFSFLVLYCALGISLRAGILTLAAEMFPVILLGAYAALRAVDPATREAALALGVSKVCLSTRILLPRAWPGILAATVLAAGHAAGSAAPVLFTASVYYSRGGLELAAPVMTLPTHLYHLVSEGLSLEQAYGTAFVLVAGLLLANTAALLLRRWSHAV